jgi:hypothetical protein
MAVFLFSLLPRSIESWNCNTIDMQLYKYNGDSFSYKDIDW